MLEMAAEWYGGGGSVPLQCKAVAKTRQVMLQVDFSRHGAGADRWRSQLCIAHAEERCEVHSLELSVGWDSKPD